MPTVRGCQLPDELLYDVENNLWYRENSDGTVTLGMTAVAAAMAGQLVAFTAKKVGRAVQAGKSCATVEIRQVGRAGENCLRRRCGRSQRRVDRHAQDRQCRSLRPRLDGQGPSKDWAAAKAGLVPGTAVSGPYEAK